MKELILDNLLAVLLLGGIIIWIILNAIERSSK